mmetsp:Transcript_31192/g.78281  ORF Transcript_31192/g.78281 Transcript_31192/m.78281 type:complete len:217 (+) Transcript_31192:1119-1769(+)
MCSRSSARRRRRPKKLPANGQRRRRPAGRRRRIQRRRPAPPAGRCQRPGAPCLCGRARRRMTAPWMTSLQRFRPSPSPLEPSRRQQTATPSPKNRPQRARAGPWRGRQARKPRSAPRTMCWRGSLRRCPHGHAKRRRTAPHRPARILRACPSLCLSLFFFPSHFLCMQPTRPPSSFYPPPHSFPTHNAVCLGIPRPRLDAIEHACTSEHPTPHLLS